MVFAILLLPGIIWQYRSQGRFSAARLLGWAAVCVYFTGLFVYTMLPFPEDPQAFCAAHHVGSNLHPFQFITDIRRETAGLPLRRRLTSIVFLQAAFNVLLFIPFGVILRRYFGRGIFLTTLLGAMVSFAIETTQYTAIFGLLPCAYRTGDVDDFILNTTGALVGAIIAPLLLWWMPSAKSLAVSRLRPRRVTVWRRWLGMILDTALYGLVIAGGELTIRLAYLLLTGEVPDQVSGGLTAVPVAAALLIVFIIPALRGRGATPGQAIVWLDPWWPEAYRGIGSAPRRLLRVSLVFLPAAIGQFVPIISAVALILGVVEVVLVPFTRNCRSLSGIISGAEIVDARHQGVAGPTPRQ